MAGIFTKAGAWFAALVAVVLGAALGGWLTDWGKTFANDSTSGPAISAIVDIDPLSSYQYVLTSPVTSAADRVALLSGTSPASDVMSLIARHGGILVNRLDVTLILQGNRSDLRIVNIQPHLVTPKTAPAAAFLNFPSAGSVSLIPVSANLSLPFPQLEDGSTPYFDSHEIDLVRGERETFRMSFQAATGYHEFSLVVTYVYGSQQYKETIGGPVHGLFQLAGRLSDYHDYGTVYEGVAANQFEVASRSQACQLFPASRGC